jgi:hypothetical protein
MPFNKRGKWTTGLFPKQMEALRACRPGNRNIVLLCGPRWSAKTVTCEHVVPWHAYETDRANICLLTITQSAAVDSGPWQHLTEIFIPDWIAGTDMTWERKPYTQAVTKKPTCKIKNKFGTVSTISVESLKVEDEVEDRFKGKAYSMIWVNELSKFKKRRTFDILKDTLRMPHLKPEQHLFLADTNPDLQLGKESWIYKLFYEFRMADDEELRRILPDIDPSLLEPLQKRLNLIEFTIDDNLSLSSQKKSELLAEFSHDPDLVAAYYYGKWVTASADAIFYKVFRPSHHVVGEVSTASNKDPEILAPHDDCVELIVGMDPGVSNSAATIMEKWYRTETIYSEKSEVAGERNIPVLSYIDEHVIIGTPHRLEEFVFELMRKMEFWEKWLGREGKVLWTFWSDRSVFDTRTSDSDKYIAQLIMEISYRAIQDGIVNLAAPIIVEAAARGPGSVQQRVDLWTKLLYDERVYFSAERAPNLILACKGLRRGTNSVSVVEKGSPHKHVWDAATYAASSELHAEIRLSSAITFANVRRASETPTLVNIPA